MTLNDKEIQWLESCFPNLQYQAETQRITGELDFCASYDVESGKLKIGNCVENQKQPSFIKDAFDATICLDFVDANGWPIVYEVGGRLNSTAEKQNIRIIDLHRYSNNPACCLGIKSSPERKIRIKEFMLNLVIPWFYRLSYTEKFGITSTRDDLWGEYSHGREGIEEYRNHMRDFAKLNSGRNELCPCGSGKKYKKCHLDEVKPVEFWYKESIENYRSFEREPPQI